MTIGKEDFSEAIEECVVRWPSLKNQLDVYYSHLKHLNTEAFYEICHRFVEEFRSQSQPIPKDFLEAYGEWKKENWKRDPDQLNGENFKIRFGRNCNECGKRNTVCIKIESDYICLQCYTGLTLQQIQGRYADLARMIEDENFTPPWVEKLEKIPF